MKLLNFISSIVVASLLFLLPGLAEAQSNYIDDDDMEYVAAEFAPIFIAPRFKSDGGVCKYNIPTVASFDANWNPLDNEKNYGELLSQYPDLVEKPDSYLQRGISTIYYEAIASKSHIFITY